MWHSLVEAFKAQLQNQVVGGALALGAAGLLVALLHKLAPFVWSLVKRCFVVTAVIDNRNDVFQAVIKWLNSLPYSRKSRYFAVTQESPGPGTVGRIPELLYSPAPGWHLTRRGGRLILIHRTLDTSALQPVEMLSLSMIFGRRRDFEGLIDEIVRANYGRMLGSTLLFTPSSWVDEWRLHTSKPKRSLDSVVLPAGVRERIVRDVRDFHQEKDRYARLGIPWRRGYLLHGPPGTGKTSLVFALAGELDLNICTLSLMNRKLNDQNLADLLQASPAGSIILLEDVDSFFQARSKQDEKMEISFSGLLNAIDGVGAQEGRVVFMTTNHLSTLDPALIRPGRIDVVFELGYAGKDELRLMVLRFFPDCGGPRLDAVLEKCSGRHLSPAEIQQVLQEADTAEGALKGLEERIARKAPLA